MDEWQEINELWGRLAPFLGDEAGGVHRTSTQVKLGAGAVRVLVELLELHTLSEEV